MLPTLRDDRGSATDRQGLVISSNTDGAMYVNPCNGKYTDTGLMTIFQTNLVVKLCPKILKISCKQCSKMQFYNIFDIIFNHTFLPAIFEARILVSWYINAERLVSIILNTSRRSGHKQRGWYETYIKDLIGTGAEHAGAIGWWVNRRLLRELAVKQAHVRLIMLNNTKQPTP